MRRRLAAISLGALFALSVDARAFCRAHGCNSDETQCLEKDGCVVTGPALFWGSRCATVGVQREGSIRNAIDYAAFENAVKDAFWRWENADCGGGWPNIHFEVTGPVDCSLGSENANVILFRDDEWPYVGGEDELGHALITYDTETGEILDADIEINGTEPITLDASDGGNDFASVVTHEVGHFLGLDHTTAEGATMTGRYRPDLASLEADDVAGICSIYPPSGTPPRASCGPQNGTMIGCAGEVTTLREVPYCSVSLGRRVAGSAGTVVVFLGALAAMLWRRRFQ